MTSEERLSRLEGVYEHLASKADVAELKLVFQEDVAKLRADSQKDMAELKLVFQEDVAGPNWSSKRMWPNSERIARRTWPNSKSTSRKTWLKSKRISRKTYPNSKWNLNAPRPKRTARFDSVESRLDRI